MPWLTGFPRENVAWYPTIDPAKCVRCGMCMNCGKNVYDWEEGGPKVARPYNCVVGCTSCANLCQGLAIHFQELSDLRRLYRKERIWQKVKAQMLAEGKITPKQ